MIQHFPFFKSASIRHAIWYKKDVLHLPYPWSLDARFNSIFFCNVFRRLDPTTKKIVEVCNKADSADDLVTKIIVSRNLSFIGTIEELDNAGWYDMPADLRLLDTLLTERRNRGDKIHTAGFLVVAGTMQKHLLPGYLGRLVDPSKVLSLDTIQEITNYLKGLLYIGPFMAYEYATDLSYFYDYDDKNTWSNPGPGAKRGMSRVLFNQVCPEGLRYDYQAFSTELYGEWKLYIEAGNTLGDLIEQGLSENEALEAHEHFERLSMREVEHWLCEYDKYKRSTPNKRRYPR